MPHRDYIGPDGTAWPSVTELTGMLPKPWLLNWYKSEVKKHGWRGWQRCEAQARRAMRLGTHVHGLVEASLAAGPEISYVPYLDRDKTVREPKRRMVVVWRLVKSLLAEIEKTKPGLVETHLIHEEKRYHGTADHIVGNSDTGWIMEDWKTSKRIDEAMPIQLALYARAWNLHNPSNWINDGRILRADKESRKSHVQVKDFPSLHHYYPVCDALRVIWDYVNKKGPWEPSKDGC